MTGKATMKLSEAILLGSTMSPQIFNCVFDGEWDVSTGWTSVSGSCALGAAVHAIGLLGVTYHIRLDDYWPFVSHKVLCPECGGRDIVCRVIANHLNDTHRWTRERIAEWVAKIEPKEEQKAEEVNELDKGCRLGTAGEENPERVGEAQATEPEANPGLPVSIFG